MRSIEFVVLFLLILDEFGSVLSCLNEFAMTNLKAKLIILEDGG